MAEKQSIEEMHNRLESIGVKVYRNPTEEERASLTGAGTPKTAEERGQLKKCTGPVYVVGKNEICTIDFDLVVNANSVFVNYGIVAFAGNVTLRSGSRLENHGNASLPDAETSLSAYGGSCIYNCGSFDSQNISLEVGQSNSSPVQIINRKGSMYIWANGKFENVKLSNYGMLTLITNPAVPLNPSVYCANVIPSIGRNSYNIALQSNGYRYDFWQYYPNTLSQLTFQNCSIQNFEDAFMEVGNTLPNGSSVLDAGYILFNGCKVENMGTLEPISLIMNSGCFTNNGLVNMRRGDYALFQGVSSTKVWTSDSWTGLEPSDISISSIIKVKNYGTFLIQTMGFGLGAEFQNYGKVVLGLIADFDFPSILSFGLYGPYDQNEMTLTEPQPLQPSLGGIVSVLNGKNGVIDVSVAYMIYYYSFAPAYFKDMEGLKEQYGYGSYHFLNNSLIKVESGGTILIDGGNFQNSGMVYIGEEADGSTTTTSLQIQNQWNSANETSPYWDGATSSQRVTRFTNMGTLQVEGTLYVFTGGDITENGAGPPINYDMAEDSNVATIDNACSGVISIGQTGQLNGNQIAQWNFATLLPGFSCMTTPTLTTKIFPFFSNCGLIQVNGNGTDKIVYNSRTITPKNVGCGSLSNGLPRETTEQQPSSFDLFGDIPLPVWNAYADFMCNSFTNPCD